MVVSYRETARYQRASVIGSVWTGCRGDNGESLHCFSVSLGPPSWIGVMRAFLIFFVVPEIGLVPGPVDGGEWPSDPQVVADEAWSVFEPRAVGPLVCGFLGVLFKRRLW